MRNFLIENISNIIILTVIIISSVTLRIVWLHTIPANLNGDEITNLSDVYRILFDHKFYLVSFMGDGSIAGLFFYWMAFWIKIFGLQNTIVALRFSVVILSCLALIPFYLILRRRTSLFIATLFTFLFSANLVFLNFSRTAWANMGIILTGLWMIYALEKAEIRKSLVWYSLAGFFAGLTLYGYQYGRVLIAGIFIYFLIKITVKHNRTKKYLYSTSLFFLVTFLTILPFLMNIFLTNDESLLRRSRSTFAFTQEKIQDRGFYTIFTNQAIATFQGFILLDEHVMARGVENARYSPPNKSIVGNAIQIIFIAGFLCAIGFREKISYWWIIFITTLLVQILSDIPPNLSRGLFYIPFIFVISAIFIFRIITYIKSSKIKRYVSIFIAVIAFMTCLSNVHTYFFWSISQDAIDARQPAINYGEFDVWQSYQIERVKKGLYPVTNYEWYEIRKTLPDFNNQQ